MAKVAGRANLFNEDSETASKWCWSNFKKRYNLSLRVPENLAAYRASMANGFMINDFYLKLESLMDRLGVKNMPGRLWNCDETGLSYVVKPNKVVTAVGKRYVYKRTRTDRGESHTLLGCMCADGSWIPPLIIFKGIRWNDNLKHDCLPNAMVRLSPKGWINSDLFLEWLQFFINSILPERPVYLFMDSHASHINPNVISLAKNNQIFLFTFPTHTSHLLQPLNVGVYKSLKSNWASSLNAYMREKPGNKPIRTNFHTILNSTFIKSFRSTNIQNAFKKSGIYPLNHNAIAPEALKPSQLTNKQVNIPMINNDQPTTSINISDILSIPVVTATVSKQNKRDSSAKCLTLPDKPLQSYSKTTDSNQMTNKKAKKNMKSSILKL